MADTDNAAPLGDEHVITPGKPDSPASKAKTRFNRALEEAKAGVDALKDQAVQSGTEARGKMADRAQTLTDDAKVYYDQAKEKAASLARDGKSRTSDALGAVGKSLAETAGTIDDKLGVQYGDYARSAARSIQDAAAKLDAKDLGELGEDVRGFVRRSPGTAIGIAAVAGFFLARLMRSGGDRD